MRYIAFIILGVMLLSCSKNEGPTGEVSQAEPSSQKDDSKKNSDENLNGKLEKAVKVTYKAYADGPIGNGVFKLDGEAKAFCGSDSFTFTFETRQKQKLHLRAKSRKGAVDNIELSIYIEDKKIKEVNGKDGRLFHRANVTHSLEKAPTYF